MAKNDGILRVCFAGGGTGGHIYPGLAVADSLRKLCLENGREVQIYWIGNSSGMDKDIVSKNVDALGRKSADFFYGIPSGKLRRYFSFKNFSDLFKIFAGLVSSFFILKKIKPDVLFSKGGFVSVPPCMAAKALKIPVFTHECDFTPGLATRLNSKSAEKILVSYEETKKYFSDSLKNKCIVTGNPIRPVFYSAKAEEGLKFLGIEKKEKPLLLVLGGSSGSKQVNDLVFSELPWLTERFTVVHQTGRNFNEEYDSPSYKKYAFIYSEMPSVIASSDIVLSRAGANSIWECSALGKPLVLIPLAGNGTRGDQVDNAKFFEERGAGFVLLGDDVCSEKLHEVLEKLLPLENRKAMAKASLSLSSGKNPSESIASIIYNRISNK